MIAPRPDYPLDYDWLAENITTRELAEIIACDVSSANGDKLQCHCSNHDDGNPSCTIDRVDGRTVVHCFGCKLSGSPVQAAAVVWGLEEPEAARQLRDELVALRNGTRVSSSRPVPSATSAQIGGESPKPNLTLEEYSKAKRLRKESVEYHGVQEELRHGGTVLAFHCRDLKGKIVAIRYRLWMEAPEGRSAFEQERGKPVYPFGVNKIPGWLNSVMKTKIVLVEGESDAMTLWANGYSAIGIPGAHAFKEEWADLVTGFESVFVWREHGEAAHQFVKKIGAAIPHALVLHDEDHDDPSALYLAVDGDGKKSKKRFAELIDDARPISDVIREIETQQVVVKSGPWGDPILPDADPTPPSYPLDKLPVSLRKFVEEISRFTQVPSDMVLLPCLSTISATIANKVVINYRWPEPPQLWTATISESGTRKSPVFNHVAGPLSDWQREEEDRTEPERYRLRTRKESLEKKLQKVLTATAKEDLLSHEWIALEDDQTAIRKLIAELPADSPPRVIVYDATPEALIPLMAVNHERLAVMAAEAEALRVVAGRYSDEANLGLWKASYDCESYAYDRVRDNTHLRLDTPALAITLLFQPTVMETIRNRSVLEGEGVFARFLYGVPKSNVGFRDTGPGVAPVDHAVHKDYDRRVERLLCLPFPAKAKGVPTLTFTSDALNLLYQLEAELEANLRPGRTLNAIPDWGNKLTGKAIRIAGVLHCFEAAGSTDLDLGSMPPIGEDMVRAAAGLVRASMPHAKVAYGMFGQDEKTQTLSYVYRRYLDLLKSGDPVTKRNLYLATRKKPSLGGYVSSLNPYIDELEDRDVLQQIKQTHGGRPTVLLVPNPEIIPGAGSEGLKKLKSHDGHDANGPFEPSEPLNGPVEKTDTEDGKGPDESFEPFETVIGEVEETEVEIIDIPNEPSEPFETPEEDQKGIDSVLDPPDSTNETPESQAQKTQKPSTSDEPDSLPPTTELF